MGLHNNRKWLLMVHAEEVMVAGDYENDGMNERESRLGLLNLLFFYLVATTHYALTHIKYFTYFVHILYSACL